MVGASASGVQLAEEIHRSGRPVSLAVGRHLRLLRRYRGRDIMAWLERAGLLDETAEAVRDLAQARAQPSLQLVGRADPRGLDLGVLQGMGVRLLGRATGVEGGVLHLADDLAGSIAAAQRSLGRVLTRVDAVADRMGVPAEAWPPAIALAAPAPARLDLRAAGIRSVVWATGFRRDYGWLQVPVLDAEGEVIHRGGITPRRASTCSGCASCAAGGRASSMASARMPRRWAGTSSASSPPAAPRPDPGERRCIRKRDTTFSWSAPAAPGRRQRCSWPAMGCA
ncbi:hypothetical protein ACFQU2_09050 [Siccirubricoccus deserti]